MTFGELLRDLLTMADVKQAQLADCLGYDVSYINKWMSGQKYPSARNNQALFYNIAAFLLKSGGDRFKRGFETAEQLPAPQSNEELKKIIAEKLSSVYQETGIGRTKRVFSENNCALGSMSTMFTGNMKSLSEAVAEAHSAGDSSVIEFVTIPLLSYCGYTQAKTDWLLLGQQLPEKTILHVRFVSDYTQQQFHTALCHDILIFLYGLPEMFQFDLYSEPHLHEMNQGIYVCQNAVLMLFFFDILRPDIRVILTRERQIISEYYSTADQHLHNKVSLVSRESFASLYGRKYFQSFFIHQEITALHTVMPLLFMSEAQLDDLVARHAFAPNAVNLCRFYIKNLQNWSAILYQSVVMSFLFDGHLSIMGETIVLSPEERKTYLLNLRDCLSETCGRLFLLSDVNPILNRADINCSIVTNGNSLFSMRHQEAHSPVIFADDEHFMSAFRTFFSDLKALPSNYMMSTEMEEFLNQCVRLI